MAAIDEIRKAVGNSYFDIPTFRDTFYHKTRSIFNALWEEISLPNEEPKREWVHPADDQIFRAFKEVPLQQLRVVIMGTEPYNNGAANGLAFDCSPTSKPLQAIENLISCKVAELPSKGVLLLNSALTSKTGVTNAHLKLWHTFTVSLVKGINSEKERVIWIMMGRYPRTFSKYITNTSHRVFTTPHPSLGNKVWTEGRLFTQVNSELEKFGFTPIF